MTSTTQNQFDQAIALINSAKRILLVSHKRPDGDTLGASGALYLALEQLGKKTVLACIDEIPQRLQFIPATEFFVKEFNMNGFDLIIISDAGAHHMTGFHEKYPDFLSKRVPIINIDHHASNDNFGTVNIVDTSASSATMIIWEMLKLMPVKITKDMAFALLTGIYNDTGGFIHSNTTKETFEIAAELAKIGVKPTEIVQPLFKQATFSQLKLWGYILENMRKNESQVLSSVLCEKDFWEIGAYAGDTGGIIDLMNTVPDAAFSMLLVENEGWVKGSLRTQRNDVNVSDIAGKFGGGGHPKAAGFRIQGRLEKQNVWKIVPSEPPKNRFS
ncbi:MAG: bifunctional oligoribonuclease/PAP phosphatase NrnA [Patescibacteria group bacterium]